MTCLLLITKKTNFKRISSTNYPEHVRTHVCSSFNSPGVVNLLRRFTVNVGSFVAVLDSAGIKTHSEAETEHCEQHNIPSCPNLLSKN